MMTDKARKLADFAGIWRLERQITHQNGPPAEFLGRAEWQPAPGGMQYFEQGKLSIAGHPPVQAERRYFWHDDLRVDFSDGRFFHQVPAMGGTARHWCDPDMYDVRYDFSGWPRFEVTWQVAGPAKEYTMVSRYTRG
jgi:hypothetical protein